MGGTFKIKVFNAQYSVGENNRDLYAIFVMPPDYEALKKIAQMKSQYEIPRLARVEIHYKIEYVRPTFLTVGTYSITLLDCNGNEVIPPPVSGTLSDTNPKAEGVVDVSKYLCSCSVSPFGMNGIHVNLGPAATVGGIPIPTTVYNLVVEVWGWWGE